MMPTSMRAPTTSSAMLDVVGASNHWDEQLVGTRLDRCVDLIGRSVAERVDAAEDPGPRRSTHAPQIIDRVQIYLRVRRELSLPLSGALPVDDDAIDARCHSLRQRDRHRV